MKSKIIVIIYYRIILLFILINFDNKLQNSTNFLIKLKYNNKEVIKMEEYIFSVITALISGVITYLVARNGNKKDIEILKIQNKAETERLINQHKIDIESMKEKQKLELELKEKEHKYKLEIMKLESENEIRKTTTISENEAMNAVTSEIFGNIFNKESVQSQLDKALKNAFNKQKDKE